MRIIIGLSTVLTALIKACATKQNKNGSNHPSPPLHQIGWFCTVWVFMTIPVQTNKSKADIFH